jgi:leader peptidase (prepilin peptidase) / N-methyltransferase
MEPSLAYRSAIVIIVMASPLVGCFTATVVRASLTGQPCLGGRSYCPECRRQLRWRDLVPLFSWLLSFGACRRCLAPIPLLYPGVELSFFTATLWASQLDQSERVLPAILLGWILIALFAFDLAMFVLPDFLTYSLLVIGLAISLNSGPDSMVESAAGAVAGALCLLLVKYSYRLATGREGLGMGDVKLFAAAGAWVGPGGLPQVLLIASLLGLSYAGIQLRRPVRAMALEKVPFGAGLCLALWFTWIFGPVLP